MQWHIYPTQKMTFILLYVCSLAMQDLHGQMNNTPAPQALLQSSKNGLKLAKMALMAKNIMGLLPPPSFPCRGRHPDDTHTHTLALECMTGYVMLLKNRKVE